MCLICHSLWHIKHIFSSGHRTTVEGLPNVHTSSTTRNSGRATLLAGKCTCRSSKVESIFICDQLKVILSFCYPVIPNSAFHWPPYCAIWLCGHFISYQFATHWKMFFYHTTDSGPDVCFLCEAPVDVKFEPCGHALMCNQCAQRAKKCPTCKVFNCNNAVNFIKFLSHGESDTFSTVK